MYRYWSLIVEPLLRAISAKRLIEIGIAYGQCTQHLLEYCLRVDGHLDFVDPEPAFDVASTQTRFGAVSQFHRCTSLEALPRLQSADVVLIDGDHNWYTVFNELNLIEAKAKETGSRFPLLLFHDVCWPYARRDLYYAPERLPQDQRQPYAQKGMVPGVTELVDNGGLNPQLFNAMREGGARNGVLTAVEDFLNQVHVGTLHTVPVLFGLGILVPKWLQPNETFMAEIRHWQSAAGLRALLDFLERERIGEMSQAVAEQMRLNADLQHLSQDREQLRAERDRLQSCLQILLGSRSWRWTRFMRNNTRWKTAPFDK